jgi:demethylmenaquinone methyltransferase/2-methoxy-6-polyprenyl-1,4-benzoquinol methylase
LYEEQKGDTANVKPDAYTATPEQKERWVAQVFGTISDDYDLMNDVESFGMHRQWKHALLRAALRERPCKVLDIACGTGDIAIALAAADQALEVWGLDFSPQMLEVAHKRASMKLGIRWVGVPNEAAPSGMDIRQQSNLHFVEGNALALPFADNSFDEVVISFGLRNMGDYAACVREMARVLRPGGRLLVLEASYPTNPLIKPFFKAYFKHIMPAMATALVHHPHEYDWLYESTEAFLSKDALVQLLESCGLENARYRSFLFGAAALHGATKPQ